MTNITEYLAEQKRITDAATEGPWETFGEEGGATFLESPRDDVLHHDERGHGHMRENFSWIHPRDAKFISSARESVPRMIAALEAVTALHKKRDADAVTGDCATEECDHEDECPTQTFETCAACWDLCEESDPYFGERGIAPVLWPCPTIRALETALGGQTDGERERSSPARPGQKSKGLTMTTTPDKTPEQIDQVARAIYDENRPGTINTDQWDRSWPESKKRYRPFAKAAIAALRAHGLLGDAPTEEQIERAARVIREKAAIRPYAGGDDPHVKEQIVTEVVRAALAAAGVAPQEPSGCSNPECPLGRAHSGPCAPEGWSSDREKLIAEAFPFDGSDPSTVIECRRRAERLIDALAAPPEVDAEKLATVIWEEQSSRIRAGYLIHTRETAQSTARAVLEALRGGGR